MPPTTPLRCRAVDPPPHPPVDRRRLLAWGSGGAVALVLGLTGGWLDRRRPDPVTPSAGSTGSPPTGPTTPTAPDVTTPAAADATARLLQALDAREVDPALVALGRAVIAAHPDEADPEHLVASLLGPPVPSTNGPGSRVDPFELAARRVTDDFRAGAVLRVDGWILAASEARAAALIALACEHAAATSTDGTTTC